MEPVIRFRYVPGARSMLWWWSWPGGRGPLVLIFFDGSVCYRCAWPDRDRLPVKRSDQVGRWVGDPVPGGVGLVAVSTLLCWLSVSVGGCMAWVVIRCRVRPRCPFDALAVIFFAGCRCAWPGRGRLPAKRVIRRAVAGGAPAPRGVALGGVDVFLRAVP